MRGMSSALSAASSACDHIRDWVKGTPSGTWVSMGVFSDGSYGAPKVIHVKHLVQYRNFHSFIFTCHSSASPLRLHDDDMPSYQLFCLILVALLYPSIFTNLNFMIDNIHYCTLLWW
jgi:hypothetical protein